MQKINDRLLNWASDIDEGTVLQAGWRPGGDSQTMQQARLRAEAPQGLGLQPLDQGE